MEDLAPDITRQRLLIEGYFDIGVDATVIADYLHALAAALDLRTYGEPTIFAPVKAVPRTRVTTPSSR